MALPRSITLLALGASAVSGVIVGWAWRGPNASAEMSRVPGAKPGLALPLHADAPTAAESDW